MKKRIVLSITLVILFFSNLLYSQDCKHYFPAQKGDILVTKNYDKKGKPTGTTKQTLIEKSETKGALKAKIKIEHIPEKKGETFTQEVTVECVGDEFWFEMNNYLDPNSFSAYQQMNVQVDADKLDLPTNPHEGQKLKDGTVTATISNQGFNIMTISVEVLNRKVVKLEKLTTPAGTFDTFKITYDVKSKLGFAKIEASGVEWYAEGIGVVKSESYNKKGKKIGYSLLEKIEHL